MRPDTGSRPWWTTVSAMLRPPLKTRGRTLDDITNSLDAYQDDGFDVVEVFAPCAGGTCYGGLDTIDYYQIDPAIGTMDDFARLVTEAHARQMRIVAFLNLGYGHEQFPAFLEACDDVREGRDTAERRMFLWSESGQDVMDRSRAPYFLSDAHGAWRWSERAQRYFWVKWEGEQGGYHLPQFNWGDPGWQAEARRILEFWRDTGIDGIVVDAVNWYIDCDWAITRHAMTDVFSADPCLFSQPEGAGGFGDDPVPWIAEGGFTCVMDYALKIWWEDHDVVRDAIHNGDPHPIEATLERYRDRVVAAGGICYIDTANMADAPLEQRLLAAATVATVGELFLEIGDGGDWDEEYRHGLRQLLQVRRDYPALCAGGARTLLPTSDDGHLYAFLRHAEGEKPVIVVLNFAADEVSGEIKLGDRGLRWGNILTGERQEAVTTLPLTLPGHGYALFATEVDTAGEPSAAGRSSSSR